VQHLPRKIFLLVLLLFSSSYGEVIFHKMGNRNIKYVKSEGNYFLYGSEKLQSNNTIIIVGKIDNPEEFGKTQSLQFIKKNRTGSMLFKNLTEIDLIEKCNSLQNLDEVESAEPNWKRERGLK
jgi:hypothetical protein